MRICFASFTYPPNSSGGGDIYAYNIVKGLKKLNHEIIVITSSKKSRKNENGIHYIPIRNIPLFKIYEFIIKARKYCVNILNLKSFDIFHFNGPTGCIFYKRELPTIMTLHHSVFSTLRIFSQFPSSLFSIDAIQECNPFNIWLESKSIKSVNQLIAVSHHTASQLKGRGISKNRINVVHNGIEIFSPPSKTEATLLKEKIGIPNCKVILFVGRLDRRKGIIFLVKAINILRKEIKDDFKCLIVGDGPVKTQILKYIKKNKLQKYFTFISNITYLKLRKIYYLSDVLILPSLYEGLGLVLLEAMASKKPVIGTNSGGIPEIIKDGKNGYLIPLGSVGKLKSTIKKILHNEVLASKMGERGYKLIQKKFTWKRAVQETVKIYNKILK